MAFDPYYEWLGIQPSEQPADFYRLLGVARFESHSKVIERAADRQMGYVRQFQAKHPAEVAKLLSELSLARITLINREKKLLYDNSLKNGVGQFQTALPQTTGEAPGRVWYVQSFNECSGPFTIDELQDRIKAGQVRESSLLRRDRGGRWRLAKDVRGLFDLPVSSAPAPGTGLPRLTQLAPVAETPDLLSGPLPGPEDRTPGRNVWVCRHCRWPVPKPKTYCPRCGYVKSVNESKPTEKAAALILLLIIALVIVIILAF